MNEQDMKELIHNSQTAISEMGNHVMRLQERHERMWKRQEEIEARQLRDMQDQWKMIHDLSNLVEELKTQCKK
jgi:hypothetical protein